MVIDLANILFRVASSQTKYQTTGTAEEKAGLAMHVAMNTVNSYFTKFKPDQVAVAFEGANNWRKTYTKSEECVSGRVYKANRIKDDSMIPFFELIKSFEQLARNHTSIVCLGHPELEGDDLIAGYVKRFAAAGDEIIIVSGDKDFMQLLTAPNIRLINPDGGKDRLLEDKETGEPFTVEYFLFEKCLRGDAGDNVGSAYPRLQTKKIKAAFTDEYLRTQIMNFTWTITDPETGNVKNVHVYDMFMENERLMDLNKQPDDIKQKIEETISHELVHHGRFNMFEFQRFLGKYGLKQISENITQYVDLFSVTGRKSPHKAETAIIHAEKKASGAFVF
jgi:hypothetical protein